MKYENIVNKYNLIYEIKDDRIFCEVMDKDLNKSYKVVLRNKLKRAEELNSSNLKLLFVLVYLYEDASLNFDSTHYINLERIKLLSDIFKDDWLFETSLLKNYLKLFNSVKINCSVEGYSFEKEVIKFKFLVKYRGKQYTFYRISDLKSDLNSAVKNEYFKVLTDLKDSLVGKRKEDELFVRFNDLLSLNLGNFLQFSLLNIKCELNKS